MAGVPVRPSQKRSPEETLALFEEKVSRPSSDACHVWQAKRNPKGYGQFRSAGKTWQAHRFAWAHVHGPIPGKLMVLHKCDNPSCVNVAHLFLGTNQDNMNDMKTKGRQAKGEDLSRLASQEVVEIRELYAAGTYSSVELARIYGVSSHSVSSLLRRNNWGHLPQTDEQLSVIAKRLGTAGVGVANGSAKLSTEDVTRIRSLWATRSSSQRKLAKDFGISDTMVGLIVSRKKWTHI